MLAILLQTAATALVVAAGGPQATDASTELQNARQAWVQCVQDIRDRDGRPPSSGIFGPRFEVRAARPACMPHIQRTRSALEAVEHAAGRPATKKHLDRLIKGTIREVAAALQEPQAANVPAVQAANVRGMPPAPAVVVSAQARTCKGSVSRGQKAFDRGDYDTALCHWLPKAKAGNAEAQNNMGVLFESGLTSQTPQNDFHAAHWFVLAAEQGLPIAMRNLAMVQQRSGLDGSIEAAANWLQAAAAAEQQQAANRAATQQGLNSLGYALGCAMAGGCADRPPASSVPLPRQSIRNSQTQSAPTIGMPAATLCPDGSYVSGPSCTIAPDGTYVGGSPVIAPDGSYVAGTPRITPNGSYIGGSGPMILCPNGTYVSGTSCRITPAGTYVGQ